MVKNLALLKGSLDPDTTMATAGIDIDANLARLTLLQKIKLLTGLGWWHTEPVPEAGIPSMRFSDGPNGVRGTRFFNGVPASCFPASTGLGSSFDIELARKVGEALGEEARAKSTHVLLAPTVNTQRSPLGGRGFESFSEDPHLNGTIASAYINGLQSKGVSATIKHFVANDQEFERFSLSSEVSERALREIYLKPFQIAIKNSNPWAVMSAYNRVNGLHVSENKRLLDDILRREWGFKGMIMSDWIGVYSTSESIKAGLDLEMPGPSVMRGRALERALVGKKVSLQDIDYRVTKVLDLLKHAEASGIPFDGPEGSIDTPELRKLLRRAAADAIVLLKNDKSLLPLSNPVKKIAIIGPNAKQAMTSGGGSARLLETYSVSPLEGITVAAKEVNAEVKYALGATSHKYLPLLDPYIFQADGKPGALIEFWNEPPSSDYTSTAPDFGKPLQPAVWSTPTLGSNCFLMDGIDETKVNMDCFIRYSAKFIPDESGDWEIGMNIAGRGNLFINQKLVIDLSTDPVQGQAFFGLGTVDIRRIVKGFKAGEEYDLEIRVSSAEFASRGSPFLCWGGIRAGGIRDVDGESAIQEALQIAKEADVVILVVGLNHDWETEGNDRADMSLPGLTNKLVSEVLETNTNTVVVNQSGTPVEMPWINEAHTLVQAFYGGNELGNGLADVLFGKTNPSGKLPLTFPVRLEDNPTYPSFGDQGQELNKIYYNEGIFVGYRGYEIKKLAPSFAFGHGLSYSQFKYEDLTTTEISPAGEFSVSFKVTNAGQVEGREVAQVYISDPKSSLPRAVKELKGFTKVHLKPAETKTATIALDREALSFYDDQNMNWVAESGIFLVQVGASSEDIRLKAKVELKETFTWTGL
ncbi:glycoside hydrolase family 3 protein [Gymnopilus junonius]|uniref:beta-glucosidase n=1 Tax=Gymnopilus junonius TaxID=109634 RepID=A0A9P5P3N8_GYMJU|nr:glycoside hydrolase family 3 protein [Gymnopilus junonius]